MKTFRLVILALIFTPLAPFAASAADEKKQHPEHASHKDQMTEHLAKLSGAEFESAFLAMMIQHHQDGIKMAKLVPGHGKSAELKSMAAKMGEDQEKEISQMTTWLQQWHKQSPKDHKMPEESMKKMAKDMAELEAAQGEEFDKLFSKMMAHHHSGAIYMAQLAEEKASHAEAKDLAAKMAKMQTEERQKLMQMHERKE
jgi:uncharacterized protein (DUF305 family)